MTRLDGPPSDRDLIPHRLAPAGSAVAAETGSGPLGIHRISVRVADLERSLGFYRDLLGLAVRERGAESGADTAAIARLTAAGHVALSPPVAGPGRAPPLRGSPLLRCSRPGPGRRRAVELGGSPAAGSAEGSPAAGSAEAQLPPAMAGRMTSVSESPTAVSSPSRTRTSSSLR